MHAFPESKKMPHPTFRLSALAALVAATAAACPLVAQATVPETSKTSRVAVLLLSSLVMLSSEYWPES